MKWLPVPALMLATGGVVMTPAMSSREAALYVPDTARARQNWILSCQGCHRADATGTPQTTPPMAGVMAKFLQVPGGREYLVRVPGVATAALSDADLAHVLNWSLVRFDPANIPADFKPYTPAEVGRLRLHPLRVEAASVRASLVARFGPGNKQQE